jgi:pSer/pThr/pTyr-binding forkhead associated (FHA) protein
MQQQINERLDRFLARIEGLSLEDFKQIYPLPFLLVEMIAPDQDTQAFQTVMPQDTENAKSIPGMDPVKRNFRERIYTLQKSGRNSFINLISVGRSINCDILVPHPTISKLHAVVRQDAETGLFTLTDPGSTNGTFVRNMPLPPNENVELRSMQTILFGKDVRATFFHPEDLYKYLQKRKTFRKDP